jgi:PAS domain S-box-containing protein
MQKNPQSYEELNNSLKQMESECALLKQLTESITDVFFAFDDELKFIYWNAASEKFTGVLSNDVIGKSLYEVFPRTPEIEKAELLYKQVLNAKMPASEIITFEHNKNLLSIEINAYPTNYGMSVLVKDISKQVEAEKELKESKEKFKSLFDFSNDGIFIHSKDGKLLDVNQRACDMLGYSKEELLSVQTINLHPEELKKNAKQAVKKLLTEGHVIFENQFIRADGTVIDVEISSGIIDTISGQIKGVVRDISERKKTEKIIREATQALKESEERLAGFMNSASDTFYLLDSSLNFVEINNAALEVVKKRRDEVIGKNIIEIVPDVLESGRYEKHLEVLKTGVPYVIEHFIPHPVFGEKHFILKSFKVGQLLGVIAYDITERKKTEKALEESRNILNQIHENYKSFFNTIDEFLFVLDDLGNIIHANDTVYKRLGYSRDELIGKPVLIIHPVDRQIEAARIVKEMLEGKAEYCPVPVITKNGRNIPVETRVNLGFWDGKPAIFGVTKDISKLRFSEEKFSKVFYLNPSACGLSDLITGRYVEVNDAFCRIFEFTIDEVIGRTAMEMGIFHGNTRDVLLSKADGEGRIINAEAVLYTKKGNTKNVILSAENISVQDKNYRYTVVHDITKLKQTEQELILAKEKAEESDRLKTAFLHNMSHEIRTPLNAMMGFTGMLSSYFNNKEKLLHFSKIIEKRGNDLLDLIDGLLDIAKIESGQLPIYLETFNLTAFLKELEGFFSDYQKQVSKQKIEFKITSSFGELNLFITTDQLKLKQILTNLIVNAFRFTNSGHIEVSCSFEKENYLLFSVADTGIGIAKEKHSEIFMRFMQASYEISRLYGGTGLGLAIVQGLVTLLNGRIWLESEPDKGSTFYFSIPVELAHEKGQELEAAFEEVRPLINNNAKILIVEDDFYNSEFLSEVLTSENFTVIHTEFGLKAVEIVASQNIDIVLLDIRLPDIHGYEVVNLMKEKKPKISIIAQTAYATHSAYIEAIESGCDDYISKPIKTDILFEKINKILKSRKAG